MRIPVGRFDMASRALDFGAEAVIAPMVNSVEDARRFAAAMKYPPVGERSWGPTYAFPRHGKGDFAEWLRDSNKRTISFAMIETRAAVDILDRILDTPGIDAIFLGPSDFSIAWTNGARVNATLEDMMQTVEAGRRAAPARPANMPASTSSIRQLRAVTSRWATSSWPWARSTTVIRLGSETLLNGSPCIAGRKSLKSASGTSRRPSSLPATVQSRNRR